MRATVWLLLCALAGACVAPRENEIVSEGTKISAVVLLKPASGSSAPDAAVTAANLGALLPAAGELERVQRYLRDAGLEVHEANGPVFAIGGTVASFQKCFGKAPRVEVEEGQVVAARASDGGLELALDALPDEVRAAIQSVSFEEPP